MGRIEIKYIKSCSDNLWWYKPLVGQAVYCHLEEELCVYKTDAELMTPEQKDLISEHFDQLHEDDCFHFLIEDMGDKEASLFELLYDLKNEIVL